MNDTLAAKLVLNPFWGLSSTSLTGVRNWRTRDLNLETGD